MATTLERPTPPRGPITVCWCNERGPDRRSDLDAPGLDVVDDATRREFLAMLVAAGLLAACGEDGDSRDASTGGDTRTIEHAGGVTEVAVRPARVAALDVTLASNLASLGLTPVAGPGLAAGWLEAQAPLLADGVDPSAIEAIGEDGEPNLEALARVAPEVILGTSLNADLYDRLVAIAPTVLIERGTNAEWKRRFDAAATAVGRADEAARVRDRYRQAIDSLPDSVRAAEVAFVRPDDGSQFRIDGSGGFAGSVAADAGIGITDAPEGLGEDSDSAGFVTLSGERLDVLAAADLIVVPDFSAVSPDLEPALAVFERNPLWASLPAVRDGRLLSVPGPIYNGGDYTPAELLLTAIEEALR